MIHFWIIMFSIGTGLMQIAAHALKNHNELTREDSYVYARKDHVPGSVAGSGQSRVLPPSS